MDGISTVLEYNFNDNFFNNSEMEITDIELENAFNYWLDHYTSCGDRHYSDTKDWKIIELYFDNIVDRILQDLPEMSEEENEQIVERISNLY